MNWKKISSMVGIGSALFFISAGVNAQVQGSEHDLSGGAGSTTTETCVFCHTPHGSDTSAAVPLWNKILPSTTYQRYSSLNTSTLDGSEAVVGSVSLACLSCHDGTQAVDTVLNTPGMGMGSNFPLGTQIGTMLPMTGSPVPMLGSDLRDDHPVSIQYGGGGLIGSDADGTALPGSLGDQDFNLPEKATINLNPAWWVDSEATPNNTREKTDMLLYTRTELNVLGEPMVECGSCHDPHNSTTGGAGSVNFLRIQNTASVICTTCHIK
jgi:hypothetical protein